MAYFRLTVVLIIGVLQVCTANAITSEDEESDPAKLFSAEELQTAKNAGITGASLVEGKSIGLTVEQTIKLEELAKKRGDLATFQYGDKFCHILDPEHKTATNYTSAQEAEFSEICRVGENFFEHEGIAFFLSTMCDYISQPDLFDKEANSFGLPPHLYLVIRHFKMKVQKASGVERIYLAKEFCCVSKSLDRNNIPWNRFKFSGLADEEVIEFGEHWNRFETVNKLLSMKNVCDFLDAKSPTDKCK